MMIKNFLHPLFCTSNRCACCHYRFDNLSILFECAELTWNEKMLWLWLAIQSAKNAALACQFSYEQISLALNQSCKQVHRALTRLKVVGFLRSDSPLWYFELLPKMCQRVHVLKPIMPDKTIFKSLKSFRGDPEGYRLHLSHKATKPMININLMNNIKTLLNKLDEENDAKPFNYKADR